MIQTNVASSSANYCVIERAKLLAFYRTGIFGYFSLAEGNFVFITLIPGGPGRNDVR